MRIMSRISMSKILKFEAGEPPKDKDTTEATKGNRGNLGMSRIDGRQTLAAEAP